MADSRYLLKLSNKSKCFSVAKLLESQGLAVDTSYAQDEHTIIVTASHEKLAHTVSTRHFRVVTGCVVLSDVCGQSIHNRLRGLDFSNNSRTLMR